MAFVAVLALAFQSLLTVEVLAAIALDSGAVRVVTICTGDGYKRIALDAENKPVPTATEECPVCVLSSCCLAALPSESRISARSLPRTVAMPVRPDRGPAGRAPRTVRSRAPPTNG